MAMNDQPGAFTLLQQSPMRITFSTNGQSHPPRTSPRLLILPINQGLRIPGLCTIADLRNFASFCCPGSLDPILSKVRKLESPLAAQLALKLLKGSSSVSLP